MTSTENVAEPSLESRMAAARRGGIAAARDGQRVDTNPHDGTADTAVERVLAKMWTDGYGEGNPMPDLDEDDPKDDPEGDED